MITLAPDLWEQLRGDPDVAMSWRVTVLGAVTRLLLAGLAAAQAGDALSAEAAFVLARLTPEQTGLWDDEMARLHAAMSAVRGSVVAPACPQPNPSRTDAMAALVKDLDMMCLALMALRQGEVAAEAAAIRMCRTDMPCNLSQHMQVSH
ncbi:hypothetical protein M0638_27330 [Roseomonas sp. NAR14]|uniref:Uncharacterized protein n=1 Tax=Roseomonas acroporae TaxID=2937791 RepID=A0A9X1YDC8_9PROT|nr:hypothetical protein [Roseomonas acroporae]MCK8788073.1 hypothetical protein [Roseomonas acroporae]